MCKIIYYLVAGILISSLPVKGSVPLLIYPQSTPARTQLITGIGIPLQDLAFEAVTTGYVIKAIYSLPDNVTKLKTKTVTQFVRKFGNQLNLEKFLDTPDNVPENSMKEFVDQKHAIGSSYRWAFYKGLEGLAIRMGLSGRACILKSICEAAAMPFHYYNGLFAELLHILLTPSSSADKLSTNSDNEYYHAEHLGRSGVNCHRVFKDCPRSLLDHFSNIQHLSQDVAAIMG